MSNYSLVRIKDFNDARFFAKDAPFWEFCKTQEDFVSQISFVGVCFFLLKKGYKKADPVNLPFEDTLDMVCLVLAKDGFVAFDRNGSFMDNSNYDFIKSIVPENKNYIFSKSYSR